MSRALAAALLALALLPAPARADGGWRAAVTTCAGIAGEMADGDWTYVGAAAEPYWRPWPFGTLVELGDGSVWTIEDTMAPWVPGGYGRLDLYNGLYGQQCLDYGVQKWQMRVLRVGWGD